ncbi:uncharacterized protein LOC135461994 [Liolophura sinensis]|uniref:uncharacterized protein LOC135461994 n=1 Tax=Liolophura sinensis TaxID=3198878 RepID=UPI00315905FB
MDIKERIILEVEKNPVLFDKSNPNYKRADLKEDIWSSIGGKLGISGPDVQTKWRNIRDCMAKHVKKNKTQSGQAATAKKPYKYEHILGFLIPTLDERATSSNLNDDIGPEDEDDGFTLDDAQNTQLAIDEVEPENAAQSPATVPKPSTISLHPDPRQRKGEILSPLKVWIRP